MPLVGPAGGVFDHREDVSERLHDDPGEEARHVMAPPASGPPPSRWSVRSIQATVPWLQSDRLSGIWRLVTGWGVRLRQGRLPRLLPGPG